MAEIMYNGVKFEILEGNRLRLIFLGRVPSEVYIPKFAMVNGERYEVFSVGNPKKDREYKLVSVQPSDKRRKRELKKVDDGFRGYGVVNNTEYIDRYCSVPEERAMSGSLVSLVLPDTIERIEEGAFSCNTCLKSVKFSNALKYIGNFAFGVCRSIEELYIPDSVTEIGRYAFANCKNLKTVKIGRGIKVIRAGAFNGCDSLTTVDIYNDPFEVSVGDSAFPPNAKVNYLCKDAAPKDTAKAEKPDAEEPKATPPVTIDLEKLIEAVIADGVITDKERSVIIKKATAAGYDADEVEILLDGKLSEKLSQSIPNTPVVEETKPEAKLEEKTSVIQEEKPATDTVKSEVAKKETSTKSKSKQSSVSYEDYVVTINEDKSISVTLKGELCDNTKKALREIAGLVGFEVDDKWTTRQFGSKLIDFLEEKK